MKKIISVLILVLMLGAMLLVPAAAAENGFVYDLCGVFSESQLAKLEQKAAACAREYDCGVYFVIMDDFRELGYGGDIYVAAYSLFDDQGFGVGDGSGIILVLSLDERDYSTFVRGEKGIYAFDEYGLIALEDEFLPYFGENQWYEGADCYISTCAEFLDSAEEGKPVRESKMGTYLVGFLASAALAFIVCTIMKAKMKNVAKAKSASVYVAGNLELLHQRDQFTHRTTHRRKIETESSGSSSRSGGGGHGRSGKF